MKNIQKLTVCSLFIFYCGFLSAKEDAMCKEIRNFSKAAKVERPVSVTLITNWSEFSKSCIHHNLESEKVFCKWLSSNTSMEFMNINVSRVVSCLTGKKKNMFNSDLDYAADTGEFSMYELSGVNSNIVLTVKYSFGKELENPQLTIKAELEP